MQRKYELTSETIQVDGRTLHRIRALRDLPGNGIKAGDLGGHIERESNLSHEGDCWVYPGAKVWGEDAQITEDAQIVDRAQVRDAAHVGGSTVVGDQAQVAGSAWVSGPTRIFGNTYVGGTTQLHGQHLTGDMAEDAHYRP